MTLEEAMERYSIPIPENIEKYDKEQYEKFDEIYLKSFYETFYTPKFQKNSEKSKTNHKKTAIVLGGQTGAGKSSLIAETKREFQNQGRRVVLIDDDNYRKFYTWNQEILSDCPEYYTKITATASSKVTPKILKFASDNGYNFIFDGTMKNTRIIKTMQNWNDYDINVKIMAASRLRSLVSIALRNGILRRKGIEGRFIEIEAHDETYYGIPETLKYLEKTGLANEIKIYSRGVDPMYPVQEYSSLENKEISSAYILEQIRARDEEKFLSETAEQDLQYLESLSQELSPKEKAESQKIINIVRQQINIRKNKNTDARD